MPKRDLSNLARTWSAGPVGGLVDVVCIVFACHLEGLNGIPEKIRTLGQLPTGLITKTQERERETGRSDVVMGKDFSSILIKSS